MYIEKNYSNNQDLHQKEWWNQLREGNRKGLESIYSAYVEDMFRYGMAIKANSSFVKDCIQEVFISLWKYKSNLKDTDNIKWYLFKSLSNKIHREIAADLSRYHTGNVEEFVFLYIVDSYEQDCIRDQGNEFTRKKLVLAIEKLPLRQKEVVQLLFFENLPYEEISSIMKLHIKSVYTLAWKAICNLRKSMISFLLILSIFRL
ncbi:MAG: sigma-70 family RNA polymerase sigma factor [Anditalea sp.]